jgi:general secretion pathway protein J
MKNLTKGFTLIEVLVALTIFAVMASLTSYILFHSFNTDKQLQAHSQQSHNIEFALTLLRRDTQQSIERAIRGNDQSLIKAFIGTPTLAEWSRGGFNNPDAIERRSTIKRIAYLCQRGALIRRTWALLDTPDRSDFHSTVLLNNLKSCSFTYINSEHKPINTWSIKDRVSRTKIALLPLGIVGHFSGVPWGDITVVLPLPAGLYA